jgi:monofunctional glycosyltransferase
MKILKTFLKVLLTVVIVILIIAFIAGTYFGIKGYEMYQSAVAEKSFDEMAEEIRGDEHFVKFSELPEIYIDAVVSAEDKRFFDHCGIDFLAISRAVWNDIRAWSFVEGGSTITQQLMKNEFFSQDKNFERKFAEIFAALDFEKEYSKTEIFELYVNTIYFGSGYYGIYDAAMGYYGKEPSELSDRESVMLAGLPNAPSVYSLDVNPKLADERMKQVLEKMQKCNVITREEAIMIYEGVI